MSNPSVTATIAVNDQASPALKELALLARKIAQETANALKPGSGDAYAAQFAKANTVARTHLDTLTNIRNMHKEIAAIAGGVVTGRIAEKVKADVVKYGGYEKGVRYQTAVGGFNADQQKLLADQRADAAKRQGVMPDDTLHAQNAFVTRNFNAEITKAATDQALTLSKALNIPAERAARIVEGMVFGAGIHLHDPVQAAKEMQQAGDRATVMAKRGAMTDEDISQNAKFSSGLATAAGITSNQNAAIAMVLKRANVGGDESGVFSRQLSARIMAPTKLGFDALSAAGIDYEQFAKRGNVSPEAIDASLKRRFGTGLNDKGRDALRESLEDPDSKALSSREGFAQAVHDAVKASGQNMSKTDEKHVTDASMRQYDLAKQGLDGAGLLQAILSKMTPQQLQGFLGDKQGGRGAMLLNGKDQFDTYLKELGDSQGLAQKIADDRMKGVGFALDNFTSAVESATNRLVQVTEGPLEKGIGAITKIVNALDSLPDNVKAGAAISGVLGLGAAALASVAGVVSLGASAAAAATSLNLLATRGIPGLTPGSIPGKVANAEATAATVASVGTKVAGVIGTVAKGIGVAAVVTTVAPILYDLVKDENTGFDRKNSPEHSRAEAAKQAIRQDADDRMARDLAAHDQQAREAAERGDAKVQAATPRPGSMGAYRRQLREEGDAQYGADPGGNATTTNVTGTVTGDATVQVNVTVNPSALLTSIVDQAKNAGKMTINGKLGTGLVGDGNATNPSQPARTHPSGGGQ
jgi:hypothetical protein